MDRRRFLRQIGFTGAMVAVAPTVLAEALPVSRSEWLIDPISKTVEFNSVIDAKGVSLGELYNFLKEEWRMGEDLRCFKFPFKSITPEIVEFKDGWKLHPSSAHKVENGMIIEEGNIAYTSNLSFKSDDKTKQIIKSGGWIED